MPNSEYLRLKALLDSNPQYKVMLDTISKAEGTWGKDAYSTTFGGGKSDWKKGKDKTVRNNSSAHGKYQFMNDTWKRLTDSLALSGFSPEEQDVAAIALLEEKGSLAHIDNGEWDKAIFSASPTWAALPKDASGKSFYANQKAKPLSTVLNYTKSNEAARAAVNNEYSNLNEKYANSKDSKQIELNKKWSKEYVEKLRGINSKDISEEAKNLEKHELKKEYYRQGKLLSINKSIEIDNSKFKAYHDKIVKLQELASQYNETGKFVRNSGYYKESEVGKLVGGSLGKVFGGEAGKLAGEAVGVLGGVRVADAAGIEHNTAQDEMNALAKELGIKLVFNNSNSDKVQRVMVGGSTNESNADVSLENLRAAIKEKTNGKIIPTEKGIRKYGKTKDEYDAEVAKNTPADTGIAADIENETVPETAQEKADRLKVEADANKKAAELLAAKNKPFESSDILDKYNTPEEWADPQFQYSPGKAKIPFDALIGLTTGLVGAAAADDVEIQYRDEKISEGMLLYAQDIAKIKNMGLPPEIEGGLKMKLQDAYQTGLENIVRASNGNRNLVLGNQGQLDKARMSGLVEIAAMDVERSDKAMAAFGEVQQYINDFDSKRDIANNERKYQEDQKKQMAGMQLAQQGMSSFIDAIQNAKENAPGSVNDMKRQYFQFATTGLLPNAKPGEVGSLEYKEAKKLEREIFQGKKQTYADWINTKTTDEKDVINNILKKNPQMDLFVNGAADFEELKTMYDQVSGTDEYKSEYQKSKGISELTTTKVEETKKEIVGEKPAEETIVDVQYLSSKDDEIKTTRQKAPVKFTKNEYPVAPTIVTTDALKPVVLLDQLVKGINGQEPGQRMNQALANYEDYQNGEGLRQRKHQEESFNRQQVFQEQLKQHNINN